MGYLVKQSALCTHSTRKKPILLYTVNIIFLFVNLIIQFLLKHFLCSSRQHVITIYAPVNLTAPCIMVFMRASPLRGGLGPGTRDICG